MCFFDKLEVFKSKVAVIDENSKYYTYGELISFADKIGKLVGKRKTIFLICENSFEFLSCYVGLIRVKSVIFLIDGSLHAEKFSQLLENYQPNYILTTKKLNFLSNFIIDCFPVNKRFYLFLTKFKINKSIDKDLAILISTSGTTGSPKFVKLSYLNLSDNSKKISDYLKIKSTHRAITTLQPHYSYGLSIINTHLIKGACLIMTQKTFFDKKFWELFKKEKASTFGGVPFSFKILKKINFNKINLPSLQYITQAGGKLEKKILKYFILISKKKNFKFFVMYGQTEASPRMSYLHFKYNLKKIGSIGKPIKGGKFFLYDEKNKIIKKKNEVGELVYKGKNVMLGYAENLNDLNKTKKKEKIYTGDLAYKDYDRFYYIVGRKSRFIKIFGIRINLDDIETHINKAGINAAVSGEDENIEIYLENLSKKEVLLSQLFNYFKIRKPQVSIFYVKKIPRNQSGKILYSKLKKVTYGYSQRI